MALATLTFDPTAVALTDDQHITAINAASTQITRAGSVSADARPLVAGEVGNTELSSTAAKDNLVAMPDATRGVLITRPISTEHKVFAMHRLGSGLIEIEYEDVAEV